MFFLLSDILLTAIIDRGKYLKLECQTGMMTDAGRRLCWGGMGRVIPSHNGDMGVSIDPLTPCFRGLWLLLTYYVSCGT